MSAQPLIKQGCVWRVGGGHNVKVFVDPWLPYKQWPFVDSEPLREMEDI